MDKWKVGNLESHLKSSYFIKAMHEKQMQMWEMNYRNNYSKFSGLKSKLTFTEICADNLLFSMKDHILIWVFVFDPTLEEWKRKKTKVFVVWSSLRCFWSPLF